MSPTSTPSDGASMQDDAIEETMRELLARARDGTTICPSDVARAVAPNDWRPLMDACRAAAGRLVGSGEAEITQAGRVVDLSTAKGPIRIRPLR